MRPPLLEIAVRISQVRVRNFRLLADVTLKLDPKTTLIVGRNNSGKTSLLISAEI
jgi:predicted ATP-dependent endonuclease of OLD family